MKWKSCCCCMTHTAEREGEEQSVAISESQISTTWKERESYLWPLRIHTFFNTQLNTHRHTAFPLPCPPPFWSGMVDLVSRGRHLLLRQDSEGAGAWMRCQLTVSYFWCFACVDLIECVIYNPHIHHIHIHYVSLHTPLLCKDPHP